MADQVNVQGPVTIRSDAISRVAYGKRPQCELHDSTCFHERLAPRAGLEVRHKPLRIPDGGEVTVDRGGVAPVGLFTARPDAKGIATPEVALPAWQVSQIGLTPEAQTTAHLNPSIFLAHHAAYELRIAAAANDSFLHDKARAAIVGRYQSFPGYDINVAFSNVYARGDYLNRPFAHLNYNEVYYNHVWPHIALMPRHLVRTDDPQAN